MAVWTKEMILYEDKDILVAYKPAGLPLQTRSVSLMDMESALKNYLAQGLKERQMPYLGIIQRLDQPVEGILLFAKNPYAARNLNAMLQKGEIEKTYLALVEGKVRPNEALLEDYLKKDAKANKSEIVDKSVKGAKLARLFYGCKEEKSIGEELFSLLEIKLFTGRHHQIRLQLSHAGTPILGDCKYGRGSGDYKEALALCAVGLSFSHPRTKKKLTFSISPKNQSFALFEKAFL